MRNRVVRGLARAVAGVLAAAVYGVGVLLIALLKAAPDGLTSRQLGVLLPGGPRRRNAALRTATAELRPNRASRRQRQIVYRTGR